MFRCRYVLENSSRVTPWQPLHIAWRGGLLFSNLIHSCEELGLSISCCWELGLLIHFWLGAGASGFRIEGPQFELVVEFTASFRTFPWML